MRKALEKINTSIKNVFNHRSDSSKRTYENPLDKRKKNESAASFAEKLGKLLSSGNSKKQAVAFKLIAEEYRNKQKQVSLIELAVLASELSRYKATSTQSLGLLSEIKNSIIKEIKNSNKDEKKAIASAWIDIAKTITIRANDNLNLKNPTKEELEEILSIIRILNYYSDENEAKEFEGVLDFLTDKKRSELRHMITGLKQNKKITEFEQNKKNFLDKIDAIKILERHAEKVQLEKIREEITLKKYFVREHDINFSKKKFEEILASTDSEKTEDKEHALSLLIEERKRLMSEDCEKGYDYQSLKEVILLLAKLTLFCKTRKRALEELAILHPYLITLAFYLKEKYQREAAHVWLYLAKTITENPYPHLLDIHRYTNVNEEKYKDMCLINKVIHPWYMDTPSIGFEKNEIDGFYLSGRLSREEYEELQEIIDSYESNQDYYEVYGKHLGEHVNIFTAKYKLDSSGNLIK